MNQPIQQQTPFNDACTTLKKILQLMCIEASIEETEILETPCLHIRTPDSNLLIGENGKHLYALQTILKRIIEKKNTSGFSPFVIDVNDYQRKCVEDLRERARMSAQRVRYFKKEVVMQPMSGYERRIVHITLTGDPDVATESIGEGENRRVVIKPVV